MVQSTGKKWLYLFIFTYLMFALMGSLALSINETFYSVSLDKNSINSDAYFTVTNYAVDWLAEDTNTVRRANKNTSSSHNGLLRVFMFAGISFTAFCITKSPFLSIKNRQATNTKNTILLKLRI